MTKNFPKQTVADDDMFEKLHKIRAKFKQVSSRVSTASSGQHLGCPTFETARAESLISVLSRQRSRKSSILLGSRISSLSNPMKSFTVRNEDLRFADIKRDGFSRCPSRVSESNEEPLRALIEFLCIHSQVVALLELGADQVVGQQSGREGGATTPGRSHPPSGFHQTEPIYSTSTKHHQQPQPQQQHIHHASQSSQQPTHGVYPQGAHH